MSSRKDSAAIVGVGVAACAVCCAGPILALLAAIGIGGAVGFAFFGVTGLMVAAIVGIVLYLRRQRRRATCTPASLTVEVGRPQVRASL